MLKIFENIVEDVRSGKNIENYVIIFLVFIIYVFDIFGTIKPETLSEITLAVLALIAIGRIVDARKIGKIDKKISMLGQSRFLKRYPDSFIEDMRTSSELWIVGITLNRTINTHFTLFKRKLEEGAKIRILLVQPDSAATEMAAFRDRRIRKKDSYDREVLSTLGDFCRMREETTGDIELRTINLAFSFGYFAVDPWSPKGKLYLEHYAFKSEEGDVPKLLLTQADESIFDAYLNQLENLWNHSSDWQCNQQAAEKDSARNQL